MNDTPDTMLAVFTLRSLTDLRKVKQFAVDSGLPFDLAEAPPPEVGQMLVTLGTGKPAASDKTLLRSHGIAALLLKERGPMKRIDLVRAIAANSKDTAKAEGARVKSLLTHGHLQLVEVHE